MRKAIVPPSTAVVSQSARFFTIKVTAPGQASVASARTRSSSGSAISARCSRQRAGGTNTGKFSPPGRRLSWNTDATARSSLATALSAYCVSVGSATTRPRRK